LDTGGSATAGASTTANPPQDPPATAMRLLSKVRSKLTPVTSVPADDERPTETAIPVSPGAPEPDPTERVALVAWAAASAVGSVRTITSETISVTDSQATGFDDGTLLRVSGEGIIPSSYHDQVDDRLNIENVRHAVVVHIRAADDTGVSFTPQHDIDAQLQVDHIDQAVEAQVTGQR